MFPDVIQIAAAIDDETEFCRYVFPREKKIPKRIVKMTGISFKSGKMYSNGSEVPGHSMRDALLAFIHFLPRNSVLVGHAMHDYDAPLLIHHMKKQRLLEQFFRKVHGLLDSLLFLL